MEEWLYSVESSVPLHHVLNFYLQRKYYKGLFVTSSGLIKDRDSNTIGQCLVENDVVRYTIKLTDKVKGA